ncbi:hypothetical protein Pfo_001914 [Paulownia fortunei]|nr:hypothetical protein Pfo_001914 [Paulownia fortunei]
MVLPLSVDCHITSTAHRCSKNMATGSMACFLAQTPIENDEEDTQPTSPRQGFSGSRGSTQERNEDNIHIAHTFSAGTSAQPHDMNSGPFSHRRKRPKKDDKE